MKVYAVMFGSEKHIGQGWVTPIHIASDLEKAKQWAEDHRELPQTWTSEWYEISAGRGYVTIRDCNVQSLAGGLQWAWRIDEYEVDGR